MEAAQLLTRLEIGAELPTPAEHQASRRAMQLFLLTRRHDPSPAQSWGDDVAKLLACGFDASHVPRAQAVLKALFKR
jgi:ATP-dependent RNA helicase SUPV3L1/SUV3